MNGKCSNYDQLFITGRRCFYVDPRKDYRIDHFYSWKSFFSGFPGSVYVWCRDQLLYSYQKLIIFLIATLLFTFPVYAEDERYEFQNIQNEALYLQGYDLNDYYDSIEYDNNIRLLSENNVPYNTISEEYKTEILEYFARSNNNNIQGYFTYSGLRPDGFYIYRSTSENDEYTWSNISYNVTEHQLRYPVSGGGSYLSIKGIRFRYNSNNYGDTIFNDSIDVNVNDLSDNYVSIFTMIGDKMTEYLAQVAQVFTWILTHITELITFILGNPFLAVSLVLFMCGAVISFYVRIKNS